MGGVFQLFGETRGDFQELGHCPFFDFYGQFWNCQCHLTCWCVQSSSVTQSCLTLGLQHARPLCPSPTPRVYLNSCPLSQWYRTTISFCHPLLLPPSIFPSIRVFSSEWVFPSGGQSIGVSASASVLPVNIQHWFPLGWTGWLSLQSKGLSSVFFLNTTVQKHQFFGAQLSL